ncbi:hypothetical protein ACS5PU_17230 [Pedobacter sp. GSP4]|uniref:hypothetical protein n=1 Tax=Pedobacter sp. GSP4 TaxID=3453716 RepID=UPI003EE827CE
MTELDFFFDPSYGHGGVFRLMMFTDNGFWAVVAGDKLLGRIEKQEGKWVQILGDPFPAELIENAGLLIDGQHFNHLPGDISARWPKLVEKVVRKSDSEYMVICKPSINFKTFERMFTTFVPAMIKDEWPIHFAVYNNDFSDDFVAALSRKVEELRYDPIQRWQL